MLPPARPSISGDLCGSLSERLRLQRGLGAEALVGRLLGRAEGFADLFPRHSFLIAGEGDVRTGESVGSGCDTGRGYGEEQVMRIRLALAALSVRLARVEDQVVHHLADEGVGLLVGSGRAGWAATAHDLEITGLGDVPSGKS